jgi:hypothetical protein
LVVQFYYFLGIYFLFFSVKVAMMESGEVGRSAVYRRYIRGPRTLPWGTPALIRVRSVRSVLTFTMKWRLDR